MKRKTCQGNCFLKRFSSQFSSPVCYHYSGYLGSQEVLSFLMYCNCLKKKSLPTSVTLSSSAAESPDLDNCAIIIRYLEWSWYHTTMTTTPAYLSDSFFKSLSCQFPWTFYCCTVIVRPPRCTHDIHIVDVKTQSSGFKTICHRAIQHSNTWKGE